MEGKLPQTDGTAVLKPFVVPREGCLWNFFIQTRSSLFTRLPHLSLVLFAKAAVWDMDWLRSGALRWGLQAPSHLHCSQEVPAFQGIFHICATFWTN